MIGCYCRVSTLEQATEGYSLDAQKAKIEKYAEFVGRKIFNYYIDDGYTGSNIHRPALQQMLQDIKIGRISTVVIYKLDRLSRSARDILNLVDLFQSYNVGLYSLSENIDLSSSFGRAVLTVAAAFAELDRESVIERLVMGKDQRLRSGYILCLNPAPFGYKHNPQTKGYEIVEKEAEIVRDIFDKYIQGYSFRKLNDYCAEKYKHPYFSNSMSCKPIIHRFMYTGFFDYKGEIIKGKNFDSIIPLETFYKAQDALKAHRSEPKRDTSPYLLTGLVYCAKCGNRYVGTCKKYTQKTKTHTNVYVYNLYGCTARIKRDKNYHPAICDNMKYRAEELDKLVLDRAIALKFNGFTDGDLVNGALENLVHSNIDLKSRKEKLLDLYMDGILTKDTLNDRLKVIDKQLENNETLIESEKLKFKAVPTTIIDFVKEKHSQLATAPKAEQRRILQLLIKEILVEDEKIIINWRVE